MLSRRRRRHRAARARIRLGRSSAATSSYVTRRPPYWASRSTNWRVLAGIRLTLAAVWDDNQQYEPGERVGPRSVVLVVHSGSRGRPEPSARVLGGAAARALAGRPPSRLAPPAAGLALGRQSARRLGSGRITKGIVGVDERPCVNAAARLGEVVLLDDALAHYAGGVAPHDGNCQRRFGRGRRALTWRSRRRRPRRERPLTTHPMRQ